VTPIPDEAYDEILAALLNEAERLDQREPAPLQQAEGAA
jgi:hypothetical protein